MTIRSAATIALALSLVCVSGASAQVGNSPFTPGAAGPSVGVSLGFRQAILNAQILGQRPNALVRGSNGALLTIQRSGRNALVLNPETGNYVPGARPNASWPTGLGTGLGWNLVSYSGAVGGYRSGPGDSLNSWISLVPSGPEGNTSSFGLYNDGGGTPIDTWILQLGQI